MDIKIAVGHRIKELRIQRNVTLINLNLIGHILIA